MRFPDLTPDPAETADHARRADRLARRIRQLFAERYGLDVAITCLGSTAKGTALPAKYAGVDYDLSILGVPEVLDRIAIRSILFEGCQLLTTTFAAHMADYFTSIYFAGHRVSGLFEGFPFDLSIADPARDSWKSDYNSSELLEYTPEELLELRKLKYILKRMNVYGSRIYGLVGPAAELAIYHWRKLDTVLDIISSMRRLPEHGADAFRTIPFPEDYFTLFPQRPDYIHTGLVTSFRYTLPNTFNRLIAVASRRISDPRDLLVQHEHPYTHQVALPTHDARLVAFMCASVLTHGAAPHIELLPGDDGLVMYSAGSDDCMATLGDLVRSIAAIPARGELSVDALPTAVKESVARALGDAVLFRGLPSLPLVRGTIYVPFDILIRADAPQLIDVIREGTHAR